MTKVDNYSVHKSEKVKAALPALEAADVFLVYLPSYSPELSDIEPAWHDIKHHRMQKRSHEKLADLMTAVDDVLVDGGVEGGAEPVGGVPELPVEVVEELLFIADHAEVCFRWRDRDERPGSGRTRVRHSSASVRELLPDGCVT